MPEFQSHVRPLIARAALRRSLLVATVVTAALSLPLGTLIAGASWSRMVTFLLGASWS
jgi:hypothetical protein